MSPGVGRRASSPLAAALLLCAIAAIAAIAARSPASAAVPSPSSPAPACPADPSPGALPSPAAGMADLTVFAAASLRDALAALEEPWAARHPGSALVVALDASSTLRAQIEQGAPADVFASADPLSAQALLDACLAIGDVVPFAGTALTIIVPARDDGLVASPADLARPGVRIVAAGPDVPISRYADALIATLATLEGYPAGFAAAVEANTVSEEDNARAVLAKVELGEGDAAIVYRTDAASSDAVREVPIPEAASVPVTYAAVVLRDAAQPALALDFLDLLTGPDGRPILARLGFLPPPEA